MHSIHRKGFFRVRWVANVDGVEIGEARTASGAWWLIWEHELTRPWKKDIS